MLCSLQTDLLPLAIPRLGRSVAHALPGGVLEEEEGCVGSFALPTVQLALLQIFLVGILCILWPELLHSVAGKAISLVS